MISTDNPVSKRRESLQALVASEAAVCIRYDSIVVVALAFAMLSTGIGLILYSRR